MQVSISKSRTVRTDLDSVITELFTSLIKKNPNIDKSGFDGKFSKEQESTNFHFNT